MSILLAWRRGWRRTRRLLRMIDAVSRVTRDSESAVIVRSPLEPSACEAERAAREVAAAACMVE